MANLTVGVEEEFFLVDLETGELVARAKELLRRAEATGDEAEGELNLCEIEIATPVCTDMDEVELQLLHRRRRLVELAAPLGLGIVGLGTHPFSSWKDQRITPHTERFDKMFEDYRLVAREQVICGCHVHIGIEDPDTRIRAMTRMRPWLASLLAITANSPFWEGEDSGFDSFRTQVWQRWPTAAIPPALTNMDEYETTVDELRNSGVMQDASHLYWHARPSAHYPTLELRIADVSPTARGATAYAALVRALVSACLVDDERETPLPDQSPQVLEAAIWRASRFGISGDLVSPSTGEAAPAAQVLDELMDRAAPGLQQYGDAARVDSAMNRITSTGNAAQRQRATLARDGEAHDVVKAALDEVTSSD